MSGSELMSKVEKEFGWKPSCGSVYPILNVLEEEKLAKVKNLGEKTHKKVYSLTSKGKSELKKKKTQKKDLADEIIRVHKMVASLYNIDAEKVEEMMKQMEDGKMPFLQVHKEVEELKMEMFRIASEDIISENKEEVKRILMTATKELRKIKKKSVEQSSLTSSWEKKESKSKSVKSSKRTAK